MQTYAIKGDEKILVTNENKNSLVGYQFIQEEDEKIEDILKYKALEKRAVELRTSYLTAEIMPLGTLRDMKLAKLTKEGEEASGEYELFLSGLIDKYGESIMQEII